MPPDDKQLARWLETQPGVQSDVLVFRKGNTIFAGFAMVRDLWGNPTMPEFEQACDTFGYKPWTDWQENLTEQPTENRRRPRGHETRWFGP
jgi:hypothetical protein